LTETDPSPTGFSTVQVDEFSVAAWKSSDTALHADATKSAATTPTTRRPMRRFTTSRPPLAVGGYPRISGSKREIRSGSPDAMETLHETDLTSFEPDARPPPPEASRW
jgi:hypothetical protein